jgi:hypothetical protein
MFTKHKEASSICIVLAITILGIGLRLSNISPFKFYPDAYESLLVSENIWNNHSVFGTLGTNGMVFPDAFPWTRPGYPLLINLLKLISLNTEQSAQIVAIGTGILAIPLAYFFIKQIFTSRLVGICAALLLAISFNHVVWGGFIFTETTGVFVMLVLLCLVVKSEQRPLYLDVLAGIIFGFAILTRYEYIILSIPVIIYFLPFKKNVLSILTIFSSTIFILSIVGSILFPFEITISLIISQVLNMLVLAGIIIFVFSIILFFRKYLFITVNKLHKKITFIFIGVSIFFIFVLLQPFALSIPFFSHELYGFRNFILDDFLLVICSIIGFYNLVKNRQQKSLAVFVGLSVFVFFIIYHKLNPEIERYFAHIIPFLLIPASWGLCLVWKWIQTRNYSQKFTQGVLIIVCLIILTQGIISFFGMKLRNNGEWFTVSYEEVAAKKVASLYNDSHAFFLVSFPEPYYFFSRKPVYSIVNHYPFIYIPLKLQNDDIYIIQDEGMREIFPAFSSHLTSDMKQFKIRSFYTHAIYHYIAISKKENKPVNVYKIKIKTLQAKITHWQ